ASRAAAVSTSRITNQRAVREGALPVNATPAICSRVVTHEAVLEGAPRNTTTGPVLTTGRVARNRTADQVCLICPGAHTVARIICAQRLVSYQRAIDESASVGSSAPVPRRVTGDDA